MTNVKVLPLTETALETMNEVVKSCPKTNKSAHMRALILAGYKDRPIADFITQKFFPTDGKICPPQFPNNARQKMVLSGDWPIKVEEVVVTEEVIETPKKKGKK